MEEYFEENEWDNIFQLWEKNNELLPFIVQRWTWRGYYAVITDIQITKWPYGKAKGFVLPINYKDEIEYDDSFWNKVFSWNLSCAGCYQWKILNSIPLPQRAIQKFMKYNERHNKPK